MENVSDIPAYHEYTINNMVMGYPEAYLRTGGSIVPGLERRHLKGDKF